MVETHKLQDLIAHIDTNPAIYAVPNTEALVQRLEEENIYLRPEVLTTFGLTKDLKWYIAQQPKSTTFFCYALPPEIKPSIKKAHATLAVDTLQAGHDYYSFIRIAGIYANGKKFKRKTKDVILAAAYNYQDNSLKALNIGATFEDFPDFYGNWDRTYGIIPVPSSLDGQFGETAGIITEAMVAQTGNHHSFRITASRYGEPLTVHFIHPFLNDLKLQPLNSSLISLKYNHPQVTKQWSVIIPSQIK